MVTIETVALAASIGKTERSAQFRVFAGRLWSGGLLVVLAFLVLYPVAMLLLGALTNTNPVVDGFGVFDLSLENFLTVLANPNVHFASQLADRLRRRHAAGGADRPYLFMGGGAHQHAVQALHRCREHAAAVRAAAGRRGRLVDPRLAEDRPAQHPDASGRASTGASTLFDGRADRVFGIYYAPYVYMFTASALRNMDPRLEEAAEITGAASARAPCSPSRSR